MQSQPWQKFQELLLACQSDASAGIDQIVEWSASLELKHCTAAASSSAASAAASSSAASIPEANSALRNGIHSLCCMIIDTEEDDARSKLVAVLVRIASSQALEESAFSWVHPAVSTQVQETCASIFRKYQQWMRAASRGSAYLTYGLPLDLALMAANCCALLGLTESNAGEHRWVAASPVLAKALMELAGTVLPGGSEDRAFQAAAVAIQRRAGHLCERLTRYTQYFPSLPKPEDLLNASKSALAASSGQQSEALYAGTFAVCHKVEHPGPLGTARATIALIEGTEALVRDQDAEYSLVSLADLSFPWFEILGVASDASEEQVVQAYRRKARKYHPDKGGSEAEFKRLRDAYDQYQESCRMPGGDPTLATHTYDSADASADDAGPSLVAEEYAESPGSFSPARDDMYEARSAEDCQMTGNVSPAQSAASRNSHRSTEVGSPCTPDRLEVRPPDNSLAPENPPEPSKKTTSSEDIQNPAARRSLPESTFGSPGSAPVPSAATPGVTPPPKDPAAPETPSKQSEPPLNSPASSPQPTPRRLKRLKPVGVLPQRDETQDAPPQMPSQATPKKQERKKCTFFAGCSLPLGHSGEHMCILDGRRRVQQPAVCHLPAPPGVDKKMWKSDPQKGTRAYWHRKGYGPETWGAPWTRPALEKLTVVQLKARLDEHHQPKTGRKQDLINRLIAATSEQPSASAASSSSSCGMKRPAANALQAGTRFQKCPRTGKRTPSNMKTMNEIFVHIWEFAFGRP